MTIDLHLWWSSSSSFSWSLPRLSSQLFLLWLSTFLQVASIPFSTVVISCVNEWMGPRSFTMHHCSLVPASYHKVVTTQVLYKAIHVDQRYIRAIHYCGGPCAYPTREIPNHTDPGRDGFHCHAVHFGLCTQVQQPIRRQAPAVRKRHSSRAYHRLSSKIRSKVLNLDLTFTV